MSENSHKNLDCGYAEQLISYLYEEIELRERERFETHLRSCQNCPTEIASFQELRFAFGEWRQTNKIPAIAAENGGHLSVKQSRETWSDWLRNFAFSPIRSLAAAAILISLFAGLYFLTTYRTESPEISQSKSSAAEEKRSTEINNPPKVSDSLKPAIALSNSTAAIETRPSKNLSSTSRVVIKTAAPILKQRAKVRTDVRQNSSQFANTVRPAYRKNVPRVLSAEEEDRSLRLADIFDEVSMK